VLIREKACGEEIDAILAPSQPPLVTALPAGGKTLRATLRATLRCLTVANTQTSPCTATTTASGAASPSPSLRPKRAATTLKSWTPRMHRRRGSQLRLSAPFWPSRHSGLAQTRRHAKYMNFSPSARRFPVNASCSSRPVYL
jgi:hypothetical protein